MSAKTFKHSGDLGDLIYALPTIRALGGGTLLLSVNHKEDMLQLQNEGFRSDRYPTGFTKYDGSRAGLTESSIHSILPLLIQLPYIDGARILNGEVVNYDLNRWRTIKTDFLRESIYVSHARAFGVHNQLDHSAWIRFPASEKTNHPRVVFSRSLRYHNAKFPWNQLYELHRDNACFVGNKEEHQEFEQHIGEIPYQSTNNILELAKIIWSSTLFIGNQSLPYAIAESMKVTTIQETSPTVLNCIFPRENATYFLNSKLCKVSSELMKRWWVTHWKFL